MAPNSVNQRIGPADRKPNRPNSLPIRHAAAGLALAAPFLLGAVSVRAETFRWIDSAGEIHYTDKLPPEEARHPHAKLNPSAKIKEQVEGEKTQDELERIKRLKQLRTEQQRILAEQKERDLSLLRTYHSVVEISTAMQGKLNTVESARKVAESNRQHQQELLESLVKRAAEVEHSGQGVPENLRESIDSTRRQIAMYQEKIRSLELAGKEIVTAFEKEQQRLKMLQEQGAAQGSGFGEWRSLEPTRDVNIVSAINCQPEQCDFAWLLAKRYLLKITGKSLMTETDYVLQTGVPRTEKDVALLVVRIQNKAQTSLYLDTSCHFSSIGDELCSTDAVKEIRAGFAPFIELGLKEAGF